MSTLAVIAFQAGHGRRSRPGARADAEGVADRAGGRRRGHQEQDGKMKLHQGTSLTGAGAAGGAMWGFVFGLLFLVPIAGMAIGAASGALAGHLSDYGMDDKWIKEVAGAIQPGGSALFVMARNTNQERVLPEMAKFGGTGQDEPHKRAAAGTGRGARPVHRLRACIASHRGVRVKTKEGHRVGIPSPAHGRPP